MTQASEQRAGQRAIRADTCNAPAGLTEGSLIYTLDGSLPVEFLTPGDRIITRAGARVLRSVTTQPAPGSRAYTLHFDVPEVIYADGVEVQMGIAAQA